MANDRPGARRKRSKGEWAKESEERREDEEKEEQESGQRRVM